MTREIEDHGFARIVGFVEADSTPLMGASTSGFASVLYHVGSDRLPAVRRRVHEIMISRCTTYLIDEYKRDIRVHAAILLDAYPYSVEPAQPDASVIVVYKHSRIMSYTEYAVCYGRANQT